MSVTGEHVVGQDGAGIYDIVLDVTLKVSSYAVVLITAC